MSNLLEPCIWLASALAWAGILAALAWIFREWMNQQQPRRPRPHRRTMKRRMR